MTPHRELEGKVALITGVTRRAGIGAAVATELARAGAAICVTSFPSYDQAQPWGLEPGETSALIAELSALSEVRCFEIDLSLPSAPKEVVARTLAAFGRLDVLVNNAAHFEPGGLEVIDAAQLDRHYAVNTRAAVLLCAEFVRAAAPSRGGRIVNITSGQGHGPMRGELAYAVTKAALDALTLTLSAELAPLDITVNALDPGPTDTGWLSDEQRIALAGTIRSPLDTARAVRTLAADAAAAITGQIIRVQLSEQ